jgi:hypothetical protein
VPAGEELFDLIGELELDLVLIRRLADRNRKSLQRLRVSEQSEYDHAALGYSVHNLYGAIEAYALRIAKAFENHLDERSWHRSVVRRMAVEVPGTRPRVWSLELTEHVDELRRFRHAFRHIYDSGLDPRKLMIAQDHVEPAVEGVIAAHAVFVDELRELARLEGE